MRPPLKYITMAKDKLSVKIPAEIILNKIIEMRDKKVMVDTDLAELYGVTTKRLNEQVKRNIKRFPEDFMFQITKDEKDSLISQFEHLNKLKFSSALPYAFTEHGAVMLASVLNSDKAIEVNIQIVRVFTEIRELLASNLNLRLEVEKIKKKVDHQDKNIEVIFRYFDELLEQQQQPRKEIGYKISKEK